MLRRRPGPAAKGRRYAFCMSRVLDPSPPPKVNPDAVRMARRVPDRDEAMPTTHRLGTWLIVAGGLVLLGVMAYALSLGQWGFSPPGLGETPEVAVYFPDSNSWRNFLVGARACEEKGLVDLVEHGSDALVVRSRRTGRALRFVWDGSLGLREMRSSLARRLGGPRPPVAVIGSSNTALTVGLARELAAHPGRPGPVLLVPSATSILVDGSEASGGPSEAVSLLDIFPHRTFRFCLNNAQLAELVVSLLADRREERPSEAVMIADPFDPFSKDLAVFFDWAIERRVPGTPRTRSDPNPVAPATAGPAPAGEAALAETVWRQATRAADSPTPRPLWVLLTTQGDPARRMLDALRDAAPTDPPHNLRVLTGDGIGRQTLAAYAGTLPFPLYAAASTSAAVPSLPALEGSGTGQIEAEMISAMVIALDGGDDPADSLRTLDVRHGDPAAIGRSLAFEAGERRGDDLGHVLEVRPGEPSLLAHEPGPGSRWTDYRWARGRWVAEPPEGVAGPR